MEHLRIQTNPPYEIRIDSGSMDRWGEAVASVARGRRCALITDSAVGPLYAQRVERSLQGAGFAVCTYTIPAGERSKNITTYGDILEFLAEHRLTRTDCIAALGGGVVGDLAGFAAATYLRGVDYVQLPTTLLAQVDSSVGGKTAVDLVHGKNLCGAFYQPRLVLMDPEVLFTLPDAVFSDGMAEVIKYGCIWDRSFFDFLCSHPSRADLMPHIETVLRTCCAIKGQVVEEDEHDHGLRMILNFGHTIGHAYEKLGNYTTYTHGQAVAAGMSDALQIGFALGVSGGSDEGYTAFMDLLKAFRLPTHLHIPREDEQAWRTVTETVGLDKKGDGDDITMIFLERIGKAVPVKMKKDAVLAHLAAVHGRA